ncbi:MAG: inorganic phosphate transporter, partial [Thermodesulfobacteriota bacterium]
TLNYLLAKYYYFKIIHYLAVNFSEKRVNTILSVLLTISAVSLAFSAGANNAANAVGPIVGLGLINSGTGAILAGIAMGVGAILFGGRVLETVGKGITELCLIRAISVEITGALLILAASIYGIPVSLAEIITSGVVGFSCAQHGFSKTAGNRYVSRIAFFWFVIPFITIGLSYILTHFYFKYDLSGLF